MSFFDVTGSPLATHLLSTEGAAARSAIESISGKPTAQFLQAAPPSTVGLAVGSVWREINSGLPIADWFWDGSRWLSLQLFCSASEQRGTGTNNIADSTPRSSGLGVWLERVSVVSIASVAHSNSIYLTIFAERIDGSADGAGAGTALATWDTKLMTSPNVSLTNSLTIGAYLSPSQVINWRSRIVSQGTVGTFRNNFRYETRSVRA